MLLGVILLFLLFGCVLAEDRNTVTLPQGRVRGRNNFFGGYRSYLGIPYAAVTERYQEAEAPRKWNDTFIADDEVICKQFSELTKSIVGTEDCLTANIFTPSKSSELLPVIVFIPGGGYYWGSNTNVLYNPKYLVKKKVVVVTINYRVGAFGYLCLKNHGAQGNVGTKDIVTALRWIKENIVYFGGDPDSVTLWGQSAGAGATVTLILSQAAHGLFHKAIVESGTIDTPQDFDTNPIETASTVARRLGYNTLDTNELLAIFRNSKANDIVKASYTDPTNDALAPNTFLPCRENPEVSQNPIITENPQTLIESAKKLSNISIIMGYNDKEGIYFAASYDVKGLKDLDKNFTKAIPKSIHFDSEESEQLFIEAIRSFYFANSSTDYSKLIDYFTDALTAVPSVRTMRAFAANPQIKLYNYRFLYDSFRNLSKLKTRLRFVRGACHADELFYIFNTVLNEFLPTLQSDLDFIDIMTTLWTNFARTGTPSADSITWLRSTNALQFLQLDKKIKMIDLLDQDRIEFWRKAEEKYGLRYP